MKPGSMVPSAALSVAQPERNHDMPPLKLLLAASEVVGFAKTGGLADVCGSLPRALSRRGHHCAVVLPLYACTRSGNIPLSPTPHTFAIPIGSRHVVGRLWQSALPGSAIPVYLIEQAHYFERDDPALGRGLYQFRESDGKKVDYADNCERFVFFCRAVLEILPLINFWPDVLHANDWQTGLVPVYLKELYSRPRPITPFALGIPQPPSLPTVESRGEGTSYHPLRSMGEGLGVGSGSRPNVGAASYVSQSAAQQPARYKRIRTLFTIHNLAYQGLFWHWDMALTGLDWRLFNYEHLEFHGHLNFLKAGIVYADALSTVSPTYAREIQTPYYGCGLQGVLAQRSKKLFGIMNGVDYSEWDPATDPHLPANYDFESIASGKNGKGLCKSALQKHYNLPQQPRTPLLGVVARLVEQKGVDLIVKAAPVLLREGVQLVVLGEGNPVFHEMLQELQKRYSSQVGLTIGFSEPLAHQIEAGADMFLMPSIYEPSGLNQLYSLRYGTVPIVRATGGLADSVVDTTPETLAKGAATGFSFVAQSPEALVETVQRALDMYRNHPDQWRQVMQTGMKQDWSWDHSAGQYEKLFVSLVQDALV